MTDLPALITSLAPLSKNRPNLQPTDTMSEAGRKILAYHFGRMLHELPVVLQGHNPDAIHDMRVATRRLRSALRLFRPFFRRSAIKPFRVRLQTIALALGAVRDLDVFRLKTEAYASSLTARKRNAVQSFLRTLISREDDARAALLQLIHSQEFASFAIRFGEFVQTPGAGTRALPNYDEDGCPLPRAVREIVPVLIHTQHSRIRAFEAILATASPETLHRLRIEAKRLRYMLESFAGVLGPEVKTVIEAAKALQDHLGDLQDARVAVVLLNSYLEDGTVRNARRTGHYQIVREYISARKDEATTLRSAMNQVWQTFSDPELRRALALSISAL